MLGNLRECNIDSFHHHVLLVVHYDAVSCVVACSCKWLCFPKSIKFMGTRFFWRTRQVGDLVRTPKLVFILWPRGGLGELGVGSAPREAVSCVGGSPSRQPRPLSPSGPIEKVKNL